MAITYQTEGIKMPDIEIENVEINDARYQKT